jgi:iron complex outermembrane receptor protein
MLVIDVWRDAESMMTGKTKKLMISRRLGSSLATCRVSLSLALAFGPHIASAQAVASADFAAAPAATSAAAADDSADTIVVTGSLLRRKNTETVSPVTVLSAVDLEQRGLQTVQAAIQSIASNNGPALTNSFTANGAFAGGASSVSLRGLSTNSTLVLFDGLRAAYYPLADDGTRNFVDLNTIPDEIVDRVEVLKDGASASYGADAVAGVVNIITKRQVIGFHLTAEQGISEKGDAANHRLTATYGFGDLADKGYNIYVSGHYIDSAALYNRDRGYPFNTADQTGLCYNGACGPNNILNGAANGVFNGLSTNAAVYIVRPATADNATALDRYQLLNLAAGCRGLKPYTLSDDDFAANATAPRTVCQEDVVRESGQIEPRQQRYGVSARGTLRISDRAEAYAEFNYERSYSAYYGAYSPIRALAPAGIRFPGYSTNQATVYGNTILALPVYICPRGTVTCTAANGTLNPNNPFASQGEVARIAGRVGQLQEFNSSESQVYRLATGLKGSFGNDWRYTLDGTAMASTLDTTAKGYVYIQHLLDVIADGSFNFVNPERNTQATLNYLSPTQQLHDSSHLYQAQATLAKDLFSLPGGRVQAVVGAAVRYESLNDPSGNPDYAGPTQRYFVLNAFGAAGHRYVDSGYFEVNAPILSSFEVDASGRFDHYSTGQDNFSPKFGAKFTPIRQIAFRGTFSRGFRIPSFAESGALPTTGYVTQSVSNLPQNFVNQHLNTQGTSADTYLTAYSIGQTTVGNPDLRAEKSRNFTIGTIIKPVSNVTFTLDYYNIIKTRVITSVNFQSAINNYYATNGGLSFNGVTIVPDEVDPDHPTGLRRIAFAQGSYINANRSKTSGIDAGLSASFGLSHGVRLTSSGEATYIFDLNTSFPDGHVEHYAGTLGNFNLTAGSGTQRWRANWQNTIDFGRASLTATAYYTSGYNYSAEDQGNVAGDCGLVPTNQDGNSYQPCNVKSFVEVDLHGAITATKNLAFYLDVLNVANRKPPIDATTYGAYLYNPVVGEGGILGRAFRVGAKVDF